MEEGIAALTIDEGEEEPWKINTGDEGTPISVEYNLVGCFPTARHPIGGVTILDSGEKQFLFKFYYKVWIE